METAKSMGRLFADYVENIMTSADTKDDDSMAKPDDTNDACFDWKGIMKKIARGVDKWRPFKWAFRLNTSDKALVRKYVEEAEKWLQNENPARRFGLGAVFNSGNWQEGAERIFLVAKTLAQPKEGDAGDVGRYFSPVANEGDKKLVREALEEKLQHNENPGSTASSSDKPIS